MASCQTGNGLPPFLALASVPVDLILLHFAGYCTAVLLPLTNLFSYSFSDFDLAKQELRKAIGQIQTNCYMVSSQKEQ